MDKKTRDAVPLRLVGLNGNAFVLLGAFSRKAKEAGWSDADVKAVAEEAMAGDYNHLLRTLSQHCKNGGA